MINRTYFMSGEHGEKRHTFTVLQTDNSLFARNTHDVYVEMLEAAKDRCGVDEHSIAVKHFYKVK